MKSRMSKIAATAALAIALVAVPSIAANADASSTYTKSGVLRASVYYSTSSNKLTITDRANDGWGARVQISDSLGGNGYYDNTSGANTTRTINYLSLTPYFQIRACSINNWVVVGCGNWSNVTDA